MRKRGNGEDESERSHLIADAKGILRAPVKARERKSFLVKQVWCTHTHTLFNLPLVNTQSNILFSISVTNFPSER